MRSSLGFGSNSCDIKEVVAIDDRSHQSIKIFLRTIHPRFHYDFVFVKT
jgi:hypothetical protein